MKLDKDLKSILERIDHKGYSAYRETRGEYEFENYILNIEHVQGDPFASSSQISITVNNKNERIPSKYYNKNFKIIAIQDYLLRKIGLELVKNSKQRGSGKSELMYISQCNHEILERTACQINERSEEVTIRLEIGFLANGRIINGRELEKIFFVYYPI